MRAQLLDVIALVAAVAVVICAVADYGWVEALTAAVAIAALIALRWRVQDHELTTAALDEPPPPTTERG